MYRFLFPFSFLSLSFPLFFFLLSTVSSLSLFDAAKHLTADSSVNDVVVGSCPAFVLSPSVPREILRKELLSRFARPSGDPSFFRRVSTLSRHTSPGGNSLQKLAELLVPGSWHVPSNLAASWQTELSKKDMKTCFFNFNFYWWLVDDNKCHRRLF